MPINATPDIRSPTVAAMPPAAHPNNTPKAATISPNNVAATVIQIGNVKTAITMTIAILPDLSFCSYSSYCSCFSKSSDEKSSDDSFSIHSGAWILLCGSSSRSRLMFSATFSGEPSSSMTCASFSTPASSK